MIRVYLLIGGWLLACCAETTSEGEMLTLFWRVVTLISHQWRVSSSEGEATYFVLLDGCHHALHLLGHSILLLPESFAEHFGHGFG